MIWWFNPFGFFFLIWIVGIGLGIYKMIMRQRAARQIASTHGLDPDQAAATTWLTPNGLDATYLAANLRQQAAQTPYASSRPPEPAYGAHNVEARLRELDLLKQQGVITPNEYEDRRKAIIAEI